MTTESSMENVRELENWIPHIGKEFDSPTQAWDFWAEYGEKMGFGVRKKYNNSDKSGVITSSRFVCSKEGTRKVDKRDHMIKNLRPERRTNCNVRLSFILDRNDGKYKVQDFVSEHNHVLHSPETVHLMSTHRKITETQALAIDLADASGIKPQVAHDLHGAQVGGSSNLSYTHRDHKNYLRSKRQKDLRYGEAGSLLKYFHQQTLENPSFQYSVQLDSEEQITNIFWADAKMLIDYALFGDVFAFDTTFGTNKENRPLGVFVGFNHFREIVVFGVALLYDETFESFKWLFETFIATHDNKMPKTIFTDQDIAMGKAIAEVMPDTWHGLCTWHIMQNATKHLLHDGSNVLRQFKACMYDYSEEASFEEAFTTLRSCVTKSVWLEGIYSLRKKWAECYMTNVFTLGMRSTQLSESFNKDLKDYLHYNLDIMRFFRQFERVIKQKRENEIISEFESREKLPRIKLRRSPLLQQAGKVYTPKIFEAFQDEYEWSTAAYIKPCTEDTLDKYYIVGISNFENNGKSSIEYRVFGDLSTQTVSCSCKMFERLGILCAHALKVLDTLNIKLLPEKYILKRWTKEARSGIIQDVAGKTILEDTHLDATHTYRDLCRKFVKIASRAASFKESSSLLETGLNNIINEVEKVLTNIKPGNSASNLGFADKDHTFEDGCVGSSDFNKVTLKRKVKATGGRRRKSWTEKFHKNYAQNHSVDSLQHVPTEISKRKKKQKVNGSVAASKEKTNILHHTPCVENDSAKDFNNSHIVSLEDANMNKLQDMSMSQDTNIPFAQDLNSEYIYDHASYMNSLGM